MTPATQAQAMQNKSYNTQSKSPRHKKPLLFFLLGLVFIISVGATYLFVNQLKAKPTVELTLQNEPTSTPTPTPDPLRPRTALLLGYAGGDHAGGALTDTMIAARIDPKLKTILLISIPRDLWVPLNLDTTQTEPTWSKINLAFAAGNDQRRYPNKPEAYQTDQGGLELAQDVVESITGLPIDFGVAINFLGFTNLLDSLGGLTINVPYSFTDQYYPITGEENNSCEKNEEEIVALTATISGYLLEQAFPCRYETISHQAGPEQMTAETALKFVRSRHSQVGGSDFGRSQRQQALLTALKQKLTTPSALLKLPNQIPQLRKYVQTNLGPSEALDLLKLIDSPADFTIHTLILDKTNAFDETKSANGQYILVPKIIRSEATSSADTPVQATEEQLTTEADEFDSDQAQTDWQFIHQLIQTELTKNRTNSGPGL